MKNQNLKPYKKPEEIALQAQKERWSANEPFEIEGSGQRKRYLRSLHQEK